MNIHMKRVFSLGIVLCLFFGSINPVNASTEQESKIDDTVIGNEIVEPFEAITYDSKTGIVESITEKDIAQPNMRTQQTEVSAYVPFSQKSNLDDLSVLDEETKAVLKEAGLLNENETDINYDALEQLPALGENGIIDKKDDAADMSNLSPYSVIGADNRKKVNTNYMREFPYRANCSLILNFPHGTYIGSGFMIGPNTVGTAGHCVYDSIAGVWVRSIVVIPGRNNDMRPYGQVTATQFTAGGNWVNGGNANDDWGMITLPTQMGNTTGYYGMKVADDSMINLGGTQICGYPGDLDNDRYQYLDAGVLKQKYNNMWKYQMDTGSGQSGAGITRYGSGGYQVIGIHAYGTGLFPNYNSGRVMDQWLFNYFLQFR